MAEQDSIPVGCVPTPVWGRVDASVTLITEHGDYEWHAGQTNQPTHRWIKITFMWETRMPFSL